MKIVSQLACVGLAVVLPAVASAQQSVKFWLDAVPGNIQGCIAADPQFTREHTFTLTDGQASVTSPGGVVTKLKLAKPNVYEADYELGRLHLHMVADLSAMPRTLTVSEKNLGCKWTAKKE